MRQARGLTLAEVLVAMVLLGAIIALLVVAIPGAMERALRPYAVCAAAWRPGWSRVYALVPTLPRGDGMSWTLRRPSSPHGVARRQGKTDAGASKTCPSRRRTVGTR
jgi:hypothetical protein